jgi:cytochrome c biogenesis factor
MRDSVTILSSVLTDVIAQGGSATMLPDGSFAVPFITRPFIYLFWIGGFMTILSPLILAMLQKACGLKPELNDRINCVSKSLDHEEETTTGTSCGVQE